MIVTSGVEPVLPLPIGDEIAERHLDGAQPAGNRRGDRGEAELDLIGVDRRLVGGDRRRGRLLGGERLVVGLLGAGLLGDQAPWRAPGPHSALASIAWSLSSVAWSRSSAALRARSSSVKRQVAGLDHLPVLHLIATIWLEMRALTLTTAGEETKPVA